MKKPWDGIIPAETQEHYRLAGFGAPSAPGRRPALLIIDVQYKTVGETPKPLREGLADHPTNCGEAGWNAIPHIAAMVQVFREMKFPILYPYVAPRNDRGGKFGRMPSLSGTSARAYDIVDEVAPQPEDILLPKYRPSSFFGTTLTSRLIGFGVDTVYITGCTTSGCVRATAVDAYSLDFKVVIPHECVFDRSPVSHAVNLFDLASKYADVTSTTEAIASVNAMSGK
jgi:maleamate amidohydrolase